jgi:transposase
MAYSTDTRKMVLSYLDKGHTYEEARRELGVGISTIKEWKKLLNETGSLEKRPLERSARKFPSGELKAYVSEHPDATLGEIAEYFGGSTSGAFDALAREGITFKKKSSFMSNVMKKNVKHSMQ